MQAETRTLTQLFQLDVRYVIPLYQRPTAGVRTLGAVTRVVDLYESEGF
jgi:hypothetical protein